MECKYKEHGTCIYMNRACNPKSAGCRLKIKKTGALFAPNSPLPEPIDFPSVDLFEASPIPTSFEKTIICKEPVKVRMFGGLLSDSIVGLHDYCLIVNDILDEEKSYPIYVIYAESSDEYFMPKEVLDYYVKKGFHPNVICRYANSFECSEPISFDNFAEISTLKMYGYSVGKSSKLSESQRHKLLDFILYNDIMTAYQVINLLQLDIELREKQPRYKQAISDWRDDIAYVSSVSNMIELYAQIKKMYEAFKDSL